MARKRESKKAPIPKFLKGIQNLFRTLSVAILAGAGLFLLVGGIFIYQIVADLPDVTRLKDFQHSHSTEVFSSDGVKIAEFSAERRYRVSFEEIPKYLLLAFVAAEDSNFYHHHGIDFWGIGRAMANNLLAGRYAQGASTITQQVARGILLSTRKKELTRKFREMILARRMEKTLSKEEILDLYLNEIFLGHRSYGIGAAARNYFHKEVKDLDLAESAMLAGLPQRPTFWNPIRDPAKSKARQRYVLHRMVAENFISEREAEEAVVKSLKVYPIKSINSEVAPYFSEYVRMYLNDKYGEENILTQGYKVTTTVRYDFQKAAERSVDEGLRETDKRLGWRGPVKHLQSEEEAHAFLSEEHVAILEDAAPARILPPEIDRDSNLLSVDLSEFEKKNSVYYGPTPIQEGKIYQAVVREVKDEECKGAIGQTQVVLPLGSANWVRVGEGDIRYAPQIKKMTEILKPYDVVSVRVSKIDRKLGRVEVSLEQEPEVQGALLSYDVNSGYVLAMVGGTDFLKSPFNRALQSKRQVGSTFKPLIYAAAIDKGFSPSSRVTDSPVVFKFEAGEDADYKGEDWKPKNYGEHFVGEVSLREALIRSMNVPTVKILNEIGVDYGISYARTLGIQADFPRDLTIALGSWSSSLEEIMRAYAIFPRLGKPVRLTYITKITDGLGNVLEEYHPDEIEGGILRTTMSVDASGSGESGSEGAGTEAKPSDRVISPQTAYVMIDMLKGVVREGTGWRAKAVKASVAGKTGTSQDFHDAWFIGFTPQVMSGVWVGYDKDIPIGQGEAGGATAAPIWVNYMNYVATQYPKEDFRMPEDIVFAYVDKKTGKLASADVENRVRVAFKVGTVPNEKGDNILPISEPGVRQTATPPDSPPNTLIDEGTDTTPSLNEEENDGPNENATDDSELLREGFEE